MTDLDNSIHHAVEAIEREGEHERKKAEATVELEGAYKRRQQMVIAVGGLVLYVLFLT